MKWRAEIRHYRTALRRLHRSRGHGIHSPFAFRFARDILREGRRFRYYAESEVAARRRALKRSGQRHLPSSRMLRRLHRVTSYLTPSRVVVCGDDPHGLLEMAVTSACSARVVTAGTYGHLTTALAEGDMLVVSALGCDDVAVLTGAVRRAMSMSGCIYITDIRHSTTADLYTSLRDSLGHAQTFSNDREAVIVCRHDFSGQYYSLWF